jgi:hypothetical protein
MNGGPGYGDERDNDDEKLIAWRDGQRGFSSKG